jgi:DNA end-binding protein Ku
VPEARDRHDENAPRQPRPFWSGTIAFGLVSIPVSLFVAHRTSRVSLRLVDADGLPLKRRYFCSAEEIPLDGDDIERGYEVDKDQFVTVTDDELDALAPEKSREIDLKRFVPLDAIDPIYFERAYFLAPEEGSTKAYRLLAHTMEARGRAGIASFVMRGKAYLVAIIGERGLLRAETLRFSDEVRTPEDVGLPEQREPDPALTRAIADAIHALEAESLDRDSLADDHRQALERLIRNKLDAGEDVLHTPDSGDPEDEAEDEDAGAEVIDLMQVLKQRLAQAESGPDAKRRAVSPEPSAPAAEDRAADLADRPKSELYAIAKDLDIPGRSSMSKEDLIAEIGRRRPG